LKYYLIDTDFLTLPINTFIQEFNFETQSVLFDITGMTKQLIFTIYTSLAQKVDKLFIVYTRASEEAPYAKDLQPYLNEIDNTDNKIALLKQISDKVTKGEDTQHIMLSAIFEDSECDDSRNRTLLASCTDKYEKLFYLLENRDIDSLEIFIEEQDKVKQKFAKAAAEAITIGYQDADIITIDNNIEIILLKLVEQYFKHYHYKNSNIELALTGDKYFTLAAAILHSRYKISKCLYVYPKKHDHDSFSNGVGTTEYFLIDTKKQKTCNIIQDWLYE